MSYTTEARIQTRLTAIGRANVVAATSDSGVAAIADAILRAANEIDAAIEGILDPAVAVESGNPWLSDRATDIAITYLCGVAGGGPPQPFEVAAMRSRKWLEEVREGSRDVPGLRIAAAAKPGANIATNVQAIEVVQ